MSTPSPFEPAPTLRTRSLGRQFEFHSTIDSTNNRAKVLAANSVHGFAVIAATQTAGRGRRGRTWFSPPGAGLYATWILQDALEPRVAPLMTLAAAVAVREAIGVSTGVEIEIKWPNDILVGAGSLRGRKLAGILVERSTDARGTHSTLLGIGINLRSAAFPPELARYATSLEAAGALELESTRLFSALCNALEVWLDALALRGPEPVIEAWRRTARGVGEEVRIQEGEAEVFGRMVGVAEDGALLLAQGTTLRRIYSGELALPGVPHPPR